MIGVGQSWFLDDEPPRYLLLTNRVLDTFQFGRPNNGGSCLLDVPGDGNLCHFHALLLCQLLDANSIMTRAHADTGEPGTHRSTIALDAGASLAHATRLKEAVNTRGENPVTEHVQIAFRTYALIVPWPGKNSPGKRSPRHATDTKVLKRCQSCVTIGSSANLE